MSILATLLGEENPVAQWAGRNSGMLTGLSASLLSSGMNFAPMQRGSMLDMEAAQQKEAQAAQQEEQNLTRQWLQNAYPEFANLPVEQGFRLAQAAEAARRSGAGDNMTANMRDWQFAQENPGFLDFLGSKGGGGKRSLTPVWGVDAEGNPVIGQLSDAGGVEVAPMPEGITFGKEPIRLDAGTEFILLDPVTRQQIGTVPKNNYKEAFEKGEGAAAGKYEGERPERQAKASAALQSLETKQQLVSQTIDKALNNAGLWTTGILGQLSSAVPGTPAYDLARTLDTIKANIGFNELQTMRDNSPTGGALGSITERELAFLQSTVASIEQAQSEQQLRENLQALGDYLKMNAQQRRAAFDAQFAPRQAGADADIDAILQQYGVP